jgi:hypothetical protein
MRGESDCDGHPMSSCRSQQRHLAGYRWGIERKRTLLRKEAIQKETMA